MPINTDLLIAASMLQDSFVDKNGQPMSAGVITCYQDNSRTTLKNWYYQSGTPGNYTYIKLPNPLTLSAAGTICDINGVDTIPFFYPYSELDQTVRQPYYITIVNHDQTNQITRANFPFLANEDNVTGQGSHENYIINNGFWRNAGTLNLTNVLQETVAPSQHDGFVYQDINFIKNVTGGQDTLTFTKFPLTTTPILEGDITPEFYINHVCSNSNTGETQKCYQFPISLHINTLAAVPYTVTIQAQNAGGIAPGQNVINLFIFQDTGTGTTAPAPFLIGSITLDGSWTKYQFSTVFPSTAGLTLGNGGDDALYLQVQMPLNINCAINFTRPSIYLSDDPPTNSFLTYDQIDSVINTPRTGDVRLSMNHFYPFGWVVMNDGTIGNPSSNAITRANVDTWQLFNVMWNLGKPLDTGVPFNAVSPMFNSAGVAINYGSSAIADFNANNALSLTETMGRVLMGTAPFETLLLQYYIQNVTGVNSGGNILFTGQHTSVMYIGQPVRFTTLATLPGNIVTNYVYFITNIDIGGANTFEVSATYAGAIAGTPVSWSSDGSGVIFLDPTGTTTGEYTHLQLQKEIGLHTHTGTVALQYGVSSVTGPGAFPNPISGTTGLNINANAPNNTPFNIVQPGVFYNIFMKL